MAVAAPLERPSTRRTPREFFGFARSQLIWDRRPITGPRRSRRAASASPAWVRAFTAGGRPLVAVIVMAMCAPGEHHLAMLAGWSTHLAWGMAAVLAAYAGIAAAVAGERRKGDPGHRTAAAGAVVSLAAAMAAQPLSHLFVTGWLSADPRPPFALVVGVSCVPPLVLGHLLHLAATPRSEAESPVPPAPPGVPHGYLTTKEVGDRLGLSVSGVNSRVHRGTLVPAMKDPDLGNLFDPNTL